MRPESSGLVLRKGKLLSVPALFFDALISPRGYAPVAGRTYFHEVVPRIRVLSRKHLTYSGNPSTFAENQPAYQRVMNFVFAHLRHLARTNPRYRPLIWVAGPGFQAHEARWIKTNFPYCRIHLIDQNREAARYALHSVELENHRVLPAPVDHQGQIHVGDVLSAMPVGRPDVIIMLTLAHYFDFDKQQKVATAYFDKLLPGGLLASTHHLDTFDMTEDSHPLIRGLESVQADSTPFHLALIRHPEFGGMSAPVQGGTGRKWYLVTSKQPE